MGDTGQGGNIAGRSGTMTVSVEQAQPVDVPTIAVVIPAFNVKNYVREAIESVRQQTVSPDEVIIIDDGSTDGTTEVLADYADLPGFRVIRTENNGLGPARNLGRMLARSQYIYFFDSDDLIKENFVERIREIIQENGNPDMIIFLAENFRDHDCDHPDFAHYRRSLRGRFSQDDCLLTELTRRREIYAAAWLYVTKSALWSENRLVFPPIIHEDEPVYFPLLALSRSTVVVPEVYYRRRIRAGSIMTGGVDARNVSGFLRNLNETMEFMAREPDLVEAELSAWRFRLREFGVRYVNCCRTTGHDIMWNSVLASILTVRQISYFFLLAYLASPEWVKTLLRKIKRICIR
ncbi:MAG: glycosyltransferase family A protein [Candidatus Electrothrix gigas]